MLVAHSYVDWCTETRDRRQEPSNGNLKPIEHWVLKQKQAVSDVVKVGGEKLM